MSRPRTAREYVALVQQAIDELKDILDAAAFDIDEIDPDLDFVRVLIGELQGIRDAMRDGSYQFGRRDLPLMRIVKQHSDAELPCIRLLYDINEAHRLGLDIDGD